MRNNVLSLRPLIASAGLALAALAAPVQAFADDEARRAILTCANRCNSRTNRTSAPGCNWPTRSRPCSRRSPNCATSSNSYPASSPAPRAAAAGSANPPGANAGDPQEQAAYDGAIDLFRKGQYKEASESFAAFTALYPASQLAPSAQFYLGSSRYALKDFKGAIEQLTSMVQKAPDNARAPDALLVIAGSQIELNNRAGAKTTLQRIVRDYPSAPAAGTAKSRLQLLQ